MPDPNAPPNAGSGSSIECPHCHIQLPADATFCLRCGNRLPNRPAPPIAQPAPPPAAPPPPRNQTIMGVPGLAQSAAPPGAPPAPPGAPPAPPAAQPVPPAAQPVPPAAQPPGGASPAPVRQVPNAQRTMMGISAQELAAAGGAPPSPLPPATAPAPAPAPTPATARSGTMMGVAMPPGALPAQAAPPPPPGPAAGEVPAPSSGRTMMGVVPGPEASPSNRPPRRENPPMMGGPSPGVPPDTVPPGSDRTRQTEDQGAGAGGTSLDIDIPGLPRRRAKKGNGLAIAFVALAAALLVGAGVLLVRYRGRFGASAALAAEARARPEGGLVVTLTVPGARPGTKVRYNRQELPLDAAGRVEIPVDPRNQVGTIELPVEIVGPDGAAEARSMRLTVPYHVTPDFRRLGEEPARIHLVFRVPPGAQLFVAGQQIQLSGDTGIAEIPAPRPIPVALADGVRHERFPIRVRLAGGATVESEYDLRIPRLPLRVEFPPATTVVNAPRMTVRGRAPGATRVLVGGQRAALANGAFTADVALTPDRTTVDVVAYGAGGAPAVATLALQRNVTPEAYLRGANRGPAALVGSPPDGTRLRVSGRVIGEMLPAAEGRTFQLVVEDRACPEGRCLVWVTPTGDVTVRDGDRVEVVGETFGTRTYTTRASERRTDRLVVAPFVTRR